MGLVSDRSIRRAAALFVGANCRKLVEHVARVIGVGGFSTFLFFDVQARSHRLVLSLMDCVFDRLGGLVFKTINNRGMAIIQTWQTAIDGSKKVYYGTYGLLFLLCFSMFAFGIIFRGGSFIWTVDGLEQQYMFFILQGEWLRELLANVFINHSFDIPMWTDSVGYGADYIVSIGNTLGNPINWISVFATSETADLLLNATVPITLFIAGWLFLCYCSYKGFDRGSSLVGSMVYSFSGYSMIAFSQIYMLYPLVLAPLVLWGIDKVFDRRSPVLLVGALSLCFFCSVTLAYAVCLLMLVYCLVRVFNLKEGVTAKNFFSWAAKFFFYTCLAALIACILFFPNVMSLLSQDRLSLDRFQSVTYSLFYYLQLIVGFVGVGSVGEDCFYGFAPLALLSITVLVFWRADECSRRRKRVLCIMFSILTIFLCLPVVGRVFNGFAYANNRWVWAYCLLIAVLVTVALPLLRESIKQGKHFALFGALAYGFVCLVMLAWYTGDIAHSLLAVMFGVVSISYAFSRIKGLFNCFMALSIAMGCFVVSWQWGRGEAGSRVPLGESYDYAVADDASSVVIGLTDGAEYRYDYAEVHQWRNGNIATGLIGSTFYNSFYNSSIDEYHTSLGLATSSMNFSYSSFNSRSTLEALGRVKYFLVPSDDDSMLPPLYRTKVSEGSAAGRSYSVYEADDVLPMAFVYDSAVSRDEYDSLSILKRQDLLTQSVVLEEMSGRDSDFESVDYYAEEVPSRLELTRSSETDALSVVDSILPDDKQDTVHMEGNSITVTQPNTVLYLNADIPASTEAYFVCQNMDYKPLQQQEDEESGGIRSTIVSALDRANSTSAKDCKILVYGDGMSQEIWYMNNKHHLYGGKKDWAVNIGYSDSERHTIALQFTEPGTYTFDSFGVYAEDTEHVRVDIVDLSS